MSQLSKALSTETASPAGKAGISSDDRAELLTNFVFDDEVPMRVEEEFLTDDPTRVDAAVHGRDAIVVSLEQNDGREPGAISSMGGSVIPKCAPDRPFSCLRRHLFVQVPRTTKRTNVESSATPQTANNIAIQVIDGC